MTPAIVTANHPRSPAVPRLRVIAIDDGQALSATTSADNGVQDHHCAINSDSVVTVNTAHNFGRFARPRPVFPW